MGQQETLPEDDKESDDFDLDINMYQQTMQGQEEDEEVSMEQD